MNTFLKKLHALKKAASSLFTYNCASCGKASRGKCLCPECSKKLVPAESRIPEAAFGYLYESAARDTLLKYKFSGDYEYCLDTLCEWLSEGFEKLPKEKIDFVVPVPSYKRKITRLSQLVKKFSAEEGLSFEPKHLRKIRETKRQHELPYEERLINLKDAFAAEPSVFGKTVLLVDDVYTTGTTAKECKNALLEKGAKKILILTALKTGEDN